MRGLAAYREVWPPFFVWQAQGACFEIEELEVTAGEDVAFAFALLRCGSEEELAERPEVRMRLTLGLHKKEGGWVVAHEHRSFPDLHGSDDQAQAEREVRGVHQHWFDRTAAKDLDGLMAHIAEDIVSYEHDTPLQYLGRDQVREVCRAGLDSASGEVTWDVVSGFMGFPATPAAPTPCYSPTRSSRTVSPSRPTPHPSKPRFW